MQFGEITIITGRRGSGKTALCSKLVDTARAAGKVVAGVLSPAVFSGGQKVGIAALDVRTGESRPLARPRTAEDATEAGTRTPGWVFRADAVAWCNEVLAAATPCDLLVVDELGPLELERGEGWMAGLSALSSRDYGQALVVVRPELLPRARELWPDAEVVDVAGACGTLGEDPAAVP